MPCWLLLTDDASENALVYPSSAQSNSSGAVEPPTGLKSMSFTVPLVATYTSIVSAGRQTCDLPRQ